MLRTYSRKVASYLWLATSEFCRPYGTLDSFFAYPGFRRKKRLHPGLSLTVAPRLSNCKNSPYFQDIELEGVNRT